MGLPIYCRNYLAFKAQQRKLNSSFPFSAINPCLEDRFLEGGIANGHYFHQDLLVARKIKISNPLKHVDIGSRVDGFIAHVASFRVIEVLDIREIISQVHGIIFKKCDLMGDIPDELVNYCDSLSCLHSLEHFGLGRYGDQIKADGYLDGIRNLKKIVRSGGMLYVSVPIGPQRIEFDAHRVFSVKYFIELFKNDYVVKSFSYIDDRGDLHEDVLLIDENIENNFSCHYGCGILELQKL